MSRPTIVAAAAALVLIGLVIGFSKRASKTVGTEVGDQAPTFQLQTLDGKTFTSDDLRGSPIVMNFWASWCGPCRAEAPLLEEKYRDSAGQVTFIGVDTRDTREAARSFVRRFNISYPIVFDPDGTILEALGINTGLPDTVFIDSRYRLLAARSARAARYGDRSGVAVLGAVDEGVLDDAIDRLTGD